MLDKIKLKKIEVIIETWEGIYDLVESIIKDGKFSCKRRWFSSETLLRYLDLPFLDPIDEAMPLLLKLEQIERYLSKENEQIMEMTQLTMEEIKLGLRHLLLH